MKYKLKNFIKELIENNLDKYKFIIKAIFVVITLIYLLFLIFEITIGEPFPFAFYVPMYALIYLQIPSIIFLIMIAIYRRINNQNTYKY
jgi:hypothetical protein